MTAEKMARRPAGLRVWITGATGGIGAALAREYASRGYRLVLSGRREDILAAQADMFPHAEVCVLPFDLGAGADELKEHAATALAFYDGLDLFIANAGLSQRARVTELVPPDLERLLRVNFTAHAILAQSVVPALRNSGGQIAVVSSLAGISGAPLRSGYSAAKHALHGFFDTLAIEEPRIAVTTVIAGFVRTAIGVHAVAPAASVYGKTDELHAEGSHPQRVARRIARALERRRTTVYVGLGSRGILFLLLRWWARPLLRRILRKRG